MKILVLFPILIYIAAIILFIKLCLDVSKIKTKLEKDIDWNEEYKKHVFFNDHEKL